MHSVWQFSLSLSLSLSLPPFAPGPLPPSLLPPSLSRSTPPSHSLTHSPPLPGPLSVFQRPGSIADVTRSER